MSSSFDLRYDTKNASSTSKAEVVSEDTDTPEQVYDLPNKNEHLEKLPGDSCTLWIRICGGFLLSVALGLIIFGLAKTSNPTWEASHKKENTTHIEKILVKPRDETRIFQYAKLPNGLQVAMVQDTRALQTAFATAVQSGSFNDPTDLPGLAHFCEHMLFLGTKTYKGFADFDNFIAAHGGWNNAYTSEEHTVFYATVSQDAATEGFDRFADFFRAPLFDEKYEAKEVRNIDSEHSKNIQDPTRQVLAVMYSLAREDTPVGRFHTGNRQTLDIEPRKHGISPVARLKQYWEEHYCPSRMKVAIVSSEPVSVQLKMIKSELGGLEAKSKQCSGPIPKFNKINPFPPNRMGKWINMQGMSPRSQLWLHFPLKESTGLYKSAPLDYIEYVLSYAGTDSLSTVLKDNLGLATNFKVLFDPTSAGSNMIMFVQLSSRGRNAPEIVLDVIWAYLALLHTRGVNQALYDSLAAVEKLKWDWDGEDDPPSTVETLVERLTRVKPADLLWADDVIEWPDPDMVESFMKDINPENFNVAYVRQESKSLDDFFEGQVIESLPHFGVKYSRQDINKRLGFATVAKWKNWVAGRVTPDEITHSIQEELEERHVEIIENSKVVPRVPGVIEGIPSILTFEHMHADAVKYSVDQPVDALLFGPVPQKLDLYLPAAHPYTKGAQVWYRSGWVSTSPKVQVSLTLRPWKKAHEDEFGARRDLLLELYGRLLDEEMAPRLVDITTTGVSYAIDIGEDGLQFEFNGFAPSLRTLIDKVMLEFHSFNRNAHFYTPKLRWERTKRHVKEDLSTFSDMPMNYAILDRNMLLTKSAYSREELLAELDQVELKDSVESISKELLSKELQLTALAMGNIGESAARNMIGDFLNKLETAASVQVPEENTRIERLTPIVNLKQPVEVRKRTPRDGDGNDAVVVSIMSGISSVESRVLLGLLARIFRPVAYNELRTQRGLGYVVNAGLVLLSNVHLLSCVLQGNAHDADNMEAAIHAVYTDLMVKRLQSLTDKEFEAYKASFRQELLQPPMSQTKEFEHFDGPVDQGGVCFELQNEMLRFLSGPLTTKAALIDAWDELVFPKKGERKIIAVKYFANKDPSEERTLEQARATWVTHGVPPNAVALLEREFAASRTLTVVGSAERRALAVEGGWFSTEQHCQLKNEKESAPKTAFELPDQIKKLIDRRHKNNHAESAVVYNTHFHGRSRYAGLSGRNNLRAFPLAAE